MTQTSLNKSPAITKSNHSYSGQDLVVVGASGENISSKITTISESLSDYELVAVPVKLGEIALQPAESERLHQVCDQIYQNMGKPVVLEGKFSALKSVIESLHG